MGRASLTYGEQQAPVPSFITSSKAERSSAFHDDVSKYERLSLQLDDGSELDYCILGDGTACILAASPSGDAIALPIQIDGHDVLSLGERCLFGYHKLTCVILPDHLVTIGPFALAGTGITEIALPQTLRRIEYKAFFNCHSLTDAQVAPELEHIGPGAFESTALSGFWIPATVTEIGFDAFHNSAVRAALPLPTFAIDPHNPRYCLDRYGALYRIDGEHCVLQQMLEKTTEAIAIMDGCELVERKAFFRHGRLRQVVLPSSLTTIEEKAFQYCERLTDVSNTEGLASVGNHAFQGSSLRKFAVGSHLESLGECALYTGESPTRIVPPSLKEIVVAQDNPRYYAVSGMLIERRGARDDRLLIYAGDAPEIIVPDAVTEICPYAFSNVEGPVRLVLHDHIHTVGLLGFAFGRTLREIVLASNECEEGFVEFRFPAGTQAQGAVRASFYSCTVNPKEIMYAADSNMLSCTRSFEWATYAIWRLQKPYYISDHAQDVMKNGLKAKACKTCLEFAQRRYMQGFSDLMDLEIINLENIGEIIGELGEQGEPEAVGYLMRLKRNKYGDTRDVNFDL